MDPSPADGEAVPRDAVSPRVQQRQAHRRPAVGVTPRAVAGPEQLGAGVAQARRRWHSASRRASAIPVVAVVLAAGVWLAAAS